MNTLDIAQGKAINLMIMHCVINKCLLSILIDTRATCSLVDPWVASSLVLNIEVAPYKIKVVYAQASQVEDVERDVNI